ncbi:MAG: hypothetical protein IKO80_00795 [Lachnospiraceae bacterium]|nr:hypothetical protein [Lachnospiraceae bacterium]
METLRNYLETMFQRYPQTAEAEKAKAELWQMMEDKYNELLADGKKETEAVGIVISEFGDPEEVAESLGLNTMLQRVEQPAAGPAQETVTREAAAEPVQGEPVLRFGTHEDLFGTTIEHAESAAAEAAASAAQETQDAAAGAGPEIDPASAASNNGAWWTWANMDDQTSGDTLYRAFNTVLSVYWPTVTCLYLCWSFLTFRWWMTWIIWPLAAVLHSILKRLVLGDVSAKAGHIYKNRLIAAVLDSYWPCVVFVYFVFSFTTHMWAVSWLIFIIAPFVRKILKNMAVTEEEA